MYYSPAAAALGVGGFAARNARKDDQRNSKTDKDKDRRPGSRRPGNRRPRKDRYPGFVELPPIHMGPPGSGPLPKPRTPGRRTGGGTGRRTGRPNQTNRNNRREALNRILSIAAAQARAGGG